MLLECLDVRIGDDRPIILEELQKLFLLLVRSFAAFSAGICRRFTHPLFLLLRHLVPYTVGDTEQFYEPLYNEDIAPDGSGGGIATWMEIYALGGYGEGRRQIMVTAQYDNCCFELKITGAIYS